MTAAIDILLVEDDLADVELTLRVLKEHNLANSLYVARDGEEALAHLFDESADAPPAPKMVLLDLKLPKVDGLEVLRKIKSDPKTKMLPVVILTSSREGPDMEQAYALGANSYLCKPVEFSEFVDVIKQMGMYWVILNERP